MLGMQQSVEVSSFRAPMGQGQDIKEKFKEIKARDERLKVQIYAQYLRMAPTNQTRLMSNIDIEERKMKIIFVKSTMQQPKSMEDYLQTNFEVLSKDIHPIDQIESHKKTGEMTYSTLTSKAIATHQLQNSLNNRSTQLQLEKASSQTKDTRIKSLEDLVIEVGHDPKNVMVVE